MACNIGMVIFFKINKVYSIGCSLKTEDEAFCNIVANVIFFGIQLHKEISRIKTDF